MTSVKKIMQPLHKKIMQPLKKISSFFSTFWKSNLTHMTTDVIFSGQRFAILAMFLLFFHLMKHWCWVLNDTTTWKGKSVHEFFFYNSHNMMQGLKDGRFCSVLKTTLTVCCLMQLTTSMEKAAKPIVQTTSFNLYVKWLFYSRLWLWACNLHTYVFTYVFGNKIIQKEEK